MAMYLYIASACIFLFMISFVGLLGNGKKMDIKGDRYKYDAVEYYKTDLDWFALIFIGFAMDSMVIGLVTSGIYKTSDQFVLPERDKDSYILNFYKGNGGGLNDQHLNYITISLRIWQLCTMRNIKDYYRNLVHFNSFIWVV